MSTLLDFVCRTGGFVVRARWALILRVIRGLGGEEMVVLAERVGLLTLVILALGGIEPMVNFGMGMANFGVPIANFVGDEGATGLAAGLPAVVTSGGFVFAAGITNPRPLARGIFGLTGIFLSLGTISTSGTRSIDGSSIGRTGSIIGIEKSLLEAEKLNDESSRGPRVCFTGINLPIAPSTI
jgi:hypothetical protein